MGIMEMIVSLVSGIAGGNVAGLAMPEKGLGAIGNSITGFLGGGAGGLILNALNLFGQKAGEMDVSSIFANIGSAGAGGAILTVIVSLIKNMLQKKS